MAIPQCDQAIPLLNDYVSTNTQSATFSTPAYNLQPYSNYSFQIYVSNSSSLNITAKVQATLIRNPAETDWADVPSSSTTITADGTYMTSQAKVAFVAIRVTFTFTGGSAKFQVYAFKNI